MIKRNQKITMLLVFIGVVILNIFQSCKQEDKVSELRKEVMSIHDEIMPKMGSLMKLKGELKVIISEMDSVRDKTKIDNLHTIISELEDADDSMMEWMRNYKDPTIEMGQREALNYLKSEKERIEKVRLKFEVSSQKARNELNIKPSSNE